MLCPDFNYGTQGVRYLSWVKKQATRISSLLALTLAVLLAGCATGSGDPIPSPTLNLEATVQAAVAAALPTETPTPTPDIDATVAARMAATMTAMPRPTPTPTLAPTWTPVPTWTPEPTWTAVPTATSTATPTPIPTPTYTPIPVPTSTYTPTPMPTLTASPEIELSDMVKQTRPAVVRISSYSGTGTGVIFDMVGQTAYIVTNYHVVESQAFVDVTVRDSTTYRGTVLGVDTVRDLAVVSICCGSFTALAFGDAATLEIGDEVVAIGYALGLEGSATVTRGIVSAVRFDSRYGAQVIQTDAPINPGNSGGPLLSLDGKVVGINTFGYDETRSGRPVEGVSFAISAATVQETLPALRAGSSELASTPVPTSRPTSAPSPAGDYTWGPLSGGLQHNPSDDFIETEYAGVLISDLVVEATFINPYSASTDPWDYGFILRNRADVPFLQFVVSSNRQWAVMTGTDAPYDRLGGGTLSRLETGAGGRNHLMVVAIGQRGWFFVNGDFIADVDLGSVTNSGDVAVITGAYTGDVVAGAVTRYEDFTGRQLHKQYGPADGNLAKEKDGGISEHWTGVWTRDLVAEAEFVNPPGSNWSYGFVIRNPEYDRLEVIGFANTGWWFHYTKDVGDYDYTELASGYLAGSTSSGDRNHLLLIAIEGNSWFFLNGQLVARLNLSHNQDHGGVSAMGDFWADHQGEPEFRDFNVWAP